MYTSELQWNEIPLFFRCALQQIPEQKEEEEERACIAMKRINS